ncbi:MAG: hypothetical protein CBB68_10735 [Rhodospirillaceae bacterium TMED8]|nr:hypothetical protein [Magnetovibrio sp.]OUT49883.1 MAG: hypothetical protein CBB68_10735 [Rhodospirillaceae bacterium TMED8]|tara:strand:+ start:433 stop:1038 length:606 start_codon:yes stop_codon:yes gene_type:complete
MIRRQLIIVAKEPRLGRVKTRLACDIGSVDAWKFYRQTLTDVSRRLSADARWTTWLGVTPKRAFRKLSLWPGLNPHVNQGMGDLGKRMTKLITDVPRGPTVLIGADIPEVCPIHIWSAFRVLDRSEAVFGPTPDGGYWLFGLQRRRGPIDVFQKVRWSSPHTLSDTRLNLPEHWRFEAVTELNDIDDGIAFYALGTRRKTG